MHSLGDTVLSDVIVVSEYALAQSDPYRVRLASIHWLSEFPRTRIECGAQTGEEDHSSGADVNRTLTGFNCNVGRKLTPTAVLRLFGGWTSDDVDGATYDSGDDTILGLGFEWNFAALARSDRSGRALGASQCHRERRMVAAVLCTKRRGADDLRGLGTQLVMSQARVTSEQIWCRPDEISTLMTSAKPDRDAHRQFGRLLWR